jgi:excinuclease ABC subunit C
VSDDVQTGQEVIQSYLKTLDSSPGVYRMLNPKGEVLYVGKARNLKARVSNYARGAGHSARIARMIFETASMMFLTTRTETEALLLEQNLIKQLKPRYNVLLRDDKSFPNILARSTPFRRSRSIAARRPRRAATSAPLLPRAPSRAR